MGKRKSSLPTLTPRRKEVLEAIQAHPGASQREIARIVGTAPGVVSTVISLFLRTRRASGRCAWGQARTTIS